MDVTFLAWSEAAEAAEELRVAGEPERSLHVDPRSVEKNTRSSRMPNSGNKRAKTRHPPIVRIEDETTHSPKNP
jgi:hypothetical protein